MEYPGVAQLVARLLWEQDAGRSSRLGPKPPGALLLGANSLFIAGAMYNGVDIGFSVDFKNDCYGVYYNAR